METLTRILGAGWQIPNWDFHGSTIVTNQYIRLTPDLRSQQGSLWNSAVRLIYLFYVFWWFYFTNYGSKFCIMQHIKVSNIRFI